MAKQILLPPDKKGEIIKTFDTTRVTLRSALRFETNSDFAKKLRAAAIARGGVIYDENAAKKVEK